MNSQRIRSIIGRCGVVLFGFGLLGSLLVLFLVGVFSVPLLSVFGSTYPSASKDVAYILAFAFLFSSEVAALGSGMVGWAARSRKIGMIGGVIALVSSLALIAVAFLRFAVG
jgi:hypothetical protein